MRQIATMAENHHLRLHAARNFKNSTSAAFVILVSPTKSMTWDDSCFASMARHLLASSVREPRDVCQRSFPSGF